MVERCDQADLAREQHAVAEHIARHVADAGDGERLRLRVHADLAEMSLDAFPAAARGDAHLLMVVTCRPAGGERVTKPEAALHRDAVGDVREGRRTLVGGDHEVRIVAIESADGGRRYDALALDVVGDVEQGADVEAVGGYALCLDRIP